jgi:hypothetical protein
MLFSTRGRHHQHQAKQTSEASPWLLRLLDHSLARSSRLRLISASFAFFSCSSFCRCSLAVLADIVLLLISQL